METQKTVNLLNGSDNKNSKFATKKWNVIDSESKGKCSYHDPIKLQTKSIESSLCEYSDAYILVKGNITVTRTIVAVVAGIDPQRKQPLDAATQVVFKNCATFKNCSTEIDGTLVDEANFINFTMPMYNLIEYSDNYSDTSGSLWQFKRDEIINNADVTNDNNAPSFKYKASIIGNTENNGTKNGVKTALLLKYLSNFWRSLEMPLINCNVELSLNWIERYLLTVAHTAILKITDAKLYVPIGTLSAEDNVKLLKLLSRGFKRTVYWNEYKVIDNIPVHIVNDNEEKPITQLLDSSYQGVKRLFVLAYNNKDGNNKVPIDSYKKYFLPRAKIENYNIKIDGRNFYDQPIND